MKTRNFGLFVCVAFLFAEVFFVSTAAFAANEPKIIGAGLLLFFHYSFVSANIGG